MRGKRTRPNSAAVFMVWVGAEQRDYERWTGSKESQTVMAIHRLFFSSSDHSSLSFSHVEPNRGEAV